MVDVTERSQADNKHRIKKLTAEKIEKYHNEIIKHNGQQVDLTGRGIETIVSLEGLQNATKLDLSCNKLTKLSQLKSVTRVTMLKLTNNKLTGDGLAEIQHLKKLVILNVAENNVTRIPFEVLRNMRTLKALVLNKNSISSLDWMPKLPELNSLIVSNNRITQIPKRVLDGFPKLTKISISHNLLEEIPHFSQLSEITELRLSHNRISKIPTHLAQLKNLKVLELSHNQIDEWSGLEALSCLENLRQLNLIGNPVVGKKLNVTTKDVQESGDRSNEDIDNEDGGNGSSNDSESDVDSSSKKKKKGNKSKTKTARLSDEEKKKIKEDKRLDAKHKQYNFKMKRLFPNLVVRDATRVLDKRVHGYIAPSNEEKKKRKLKKPESFDKKMKETSTGKRKRDNDPIESKDEIEIFRPTDRIVTKNDAEKPSKKDKKADKKHASGKLVGNEPSKEVIAALEPSLPSNDYEEHVKANDSAPMDIVAPSGSVSMCDARTKKKKEKVSEKKQQEKQDKIKDQRQFKAIASGVMAVKKFKNAKKSKSTQEKPMDLMQINFTPNVGYGGSSTWD
ncbi:unnamed protein product [Peronospora belbahrii]|uniref:U2A'/phosphoprotein 32 family A C-terminal domain-containing protein n=1 Tax=Peronospora belbahrii TaxID=622444 RepID=A0AAU9L4N8_9STRA|nr:unnamed protein product [Peronospora belbahrii]